MTSKLYITEYARTADGFLQEPEILTQVVTYSTHAESSAFNASTSFVRLHTDGICSVVFGTAPVATTANRRMALGQTETFRVPNNKAYIVSAITNT